MTVDPAGTGTPMSERMQSLLSRAVEDQLSEQRQLAGVLADLGGQLARVDDDIAALRSQGAGSGATDAALAALSSDVREAVRLLGERIEATDQGLRERLAALEAKVDGLLPALQAQGDRLAAQLDALAAQLDALAASDAQAEGRLAAHIDEAVLALAEALLRRRVRPSAAPAEPDAGPAFAAADAAPVETSGETSAETPAGDAEPVAAWQVPVAAAPGADPAGGGLDPDAGRRRPWWRPGD